ncbi:MAG: WG repeat-containing protein [Actinomycetota bacterium]
MKKIKGTIVLLCALWFVFAASSCQLLPGKTVVEEKDAPKVLLPFSGAVNGKMKWGFMDGKGKRVIDLQYEAVEFFSEELARVKLGDNKCECWGFIDETGKMVIQPQFNEPGSSDIDFLMNPERFGFSDGVAVAKLKEGGKQVVIDKTGQILFTAPEGYTLYNKFSEGLVKFSTSPGGYYSPYGFMDKTGKVVLDPIHSNAGSFHDGLASVELPTFPTTYGFIDKTGKKVIEGFDQVFDFSEGLAAVKKGDKWGFIDKNGQTIIEPQYYEVGSFSDGWSWIRAEAFEHKYFYIDKTGKSALPLPEKFVLSLSDFSEGLTWLDNDVIDKTGKVIGTMPNLPIANREAIRKFKFKDGVSIMTDGKFAFYLNKEGKEIKQQ